MTWRLGVRHSTGYRYGGPVTSSYNEARLTPRNEAGQLVLDHRVDISPTAGAYRYEDYWGTVVTSFDLHVPHVELAVTATSVLETTAAPNPDGTSASWQDLRSERIRDRWVEQLLPTTFTAPSEGMSAALEELRSAPEPVTAAARAMAWLRERMAYVPGATGVHTSAAQALVEGRGVCQDFAHIAIALLRASGIPAVYVSGYMHPQADAPVGETVTGESHAWVEYWVGEWHSYDPTNDRVPDEAYATVARGRDYLDVAPLRGLYTGAHGSELTVSVEVTRLA